MSGEPGPNTTERCPRCGGGFHCGIDDAGPCACTGITLDAAVQQQLRERYRGCLCLRCLQALAQTSRPAPALPLPLPESGCALESLERRQGPPHAIRTDAALYDYVAALKNRFMRGAGPITKVAFDPKLQPVQHALGTHTRISRVQGNRLKAKREIRIASVFKSAPAPFLTMIVVHELAHLKHAAHDKAFYALCLHMEPDYHQLERDLRLWLGGPDRAKPAAAPVLAAPNQPAPWV
jgi:UTP pyrophosphatase